MTKKIRIDELLVYRDMVDSLEHARALIMAGKIFVLDRCVTKAGYLVSNEASLEIKGNKNHRWVSRGGLKLEHALKIFDLNVTGMTAIDLGCSTGGFSDVLLEYGVKKVYAVDVGYGEFAWRLRNDQRVMLLERTNARFITNNEIPDKLDIIVCDASFISATVILTAAMQLVAHNAMMVTLVKPQFEVDSHEVEAGGIIVSKELHQKSIDKVKTFLTNNGWIVKGVVESPIKGMKGNTEFLLFAVKSNL
jgi:23S rRNA (cytidine1920-2'-O)/16S rRNA (cytidine1409-2'-O)-methyltransferase